MSSASKPTDRGAVYGLCLHIKPQYLRWDPHNVCIGCTAMPKMEAAMRDFFFEGDPSCRFCRAVPKAVRKRWIDTFRDYWELEPWSGKTTEFNEVHEGVARLAMHSSTPPNSRRASSSTPSHRTLEDSSELPGLVSYYPPFGYGAASVGELR